VSLRQALQQKSFAARNLRTVIITLDLLVSSNDEGAVYEQGNKAASVCGTVELKSAVIVIGLRETHTVGPLLAALGATHSTVTLFAKLRGLSMFRPSNAAV
jgi:hypothetical protein